MTAQRRKIRPELRRVTAYLSQEEYEWIRQGAKLAGRTISHHIGELLSDARTHWEVELSEMREEREVADLPW
jgi:energy-converting hydrogenase Eha subunit F